MSNAILDNATGAFYDDFNGRSAEFTQVVLDGKSTGTSTNLTAASIAATDHGQVGEDYKASNVEFLP